jgi:adenylate kinase
MKIYFTTALRSADVSDRSNTSNTPNIISCDVFIQLLSNYGEVLTKHMRDPATHDMGFHSDKEIYERDMQLLNEADLIIGEVSNASLGVGFILAKAIELKKKVGVFKFASSLLLNRKLSAMINGCDSITKFSYSNMISLKTQLELFIKGKSHAPKLYLFGLPGSGKSTVGNKLEKDLGLVHISTGQLLRQLLNTDNADNVNHQLISKIKSYIEAGKLVPADIMDSIVKKRLLQEDCLTKGYVLDGYPPSYSDYLNLANDPFFDPDLILYFVCSDKLSVTRQITRNERPTDKDPEIIKHRINEFHKMVPPYEELQKNWFLDKKINICAINANLSEHEVYALVLNTMKVHRLINKLTDSGITKSFFPMDMPQIKSHEVEEGRLSFAMELMEAPEKDNFKRTKPNFAKPNFAKPNTTHYHFHVDALDAPSLWKLTGEICLMDQSILQQMKIYPIRNLALGPQLMQTQFSELYRQMMNFHTIDEGQNSESNEAFITGRLGDFSKHDYENLFFVLQSIAQSKRRYMCELEEYIGEWVLNSMDQVITETNYLKLTLPTQSKTHYLEQLDQLVEGKNLLEPYQKKGSMIYELHLGFDIEAETIPIDLKELIKECASNDIDNGGWFIFKKESEITHRQIFCYRSNQFVLASTNVDFNESASYYCKMVESQARNLRGSVGKLLSAQLLSAQLLSAQLIEVPAISFSVEIVHRIWQW